MLSRTKRSLACKYASALLMPIANSTPCVISPAETCPQQLAQVCPQRPGWARIYWLHVDGLFSIGLSWIFKGACVRGNAAGRFEADSLFEPDCNAHINLKAPFSKDRCALEACKYNTRVRAGSQILPGARGTQYTARKNGATSADSR